MDGGFPVFMPDGTTSNTSLVLDKAEMFGPGDILSFDDATTEKIRVISVNYDDKVLEVERGYHETDPEFHAKDSYIIFEPEAIDGSSYVAPCPDKTVDSTASIKQMLLSNNVKLSDPTDLLLTASMECALWTNVQTTQDTYGEAFAQVKVWIEINGVTVPVHPNEPYLNDDGSPNYDYGKVVMCSRATKISSGFNILTALEGLEGFDPVTLQNASLEHKHQIEYFIRTMTKTRNAQAFSWYALDMGTLSESETFTANPDGTYDIELWAELDAQAANLSGFGADYAAAAVGKRTLIVEPVKFPTGYGY